LIKALRKDFDAPNAKFVCATLGQTAKGAKGNEGHILNAQLAVDGKTGKYPEFKGNVASVYSKPFCHGGASNGHYSGNPETYMDIGQAMGAAMAELLLSDKSAEKTKAELRKLKEEEAEETAVTRPTPVIDASNPKADKLLKTAQDAEKMGQHDAAKSFYQSLVVQFPKSQAAKKAAERLKQL